jgi:hypothetical protein
MLSRLALGSLALGRCSRCRAPPVARIGRHVRSDRAGPGRSGRREGARNERQQRDEIGDPGTRGSHPWSTKSSSSWAPAGQALNRRARSMLQVSANTRCQSIPGIAARLRGDRPPHPAGDHGSKRSRASRPTTQRSVKPSGGWYRAPGSRARRAKRRVIPTVILYDGWYEAITTVSQEHGVHPFHHAERDGAVSRVGGAGQAERQPAPAKAASLARICPPARRQPPGRSCGRWGGGRTAIAVLPAVAQSPPNGAISPAGGR